MTEIQRHYMEKAKRTRQVLGTLLIVFGVLFFTKDYDFMPRIISDYLVSWQSLLIGVGLAGLISKKKNGFFSLILIFIGAWFILNDFYDLPVRGAQIFWSLLFIVSGFFLLSKFGKNSTNHHHISFTERELTEDFIDEVNIFGGGKSRIESQNFKGGEITAIFGGSEIDFTGAKLADGVNVLDVSFIFGGCSIIVPRTWNIKVEVTGILGGFSDKRYNLSEEAKIQNKTLIIKGAAIFGGGEIKSY